MSGIRARLSGYRPAVPDRLAAMARGGARGLVAAMAMSGVRSLTSNLDLLDAPPPEQIVTRHAPERVQRLDEEHREALTEVVHWIYGAGGGLVFGLLPRPVRAHAAAGPVYGVLVWVAFELSLAPLLDVQPGRRKVLGRVMLVIDHLLYGVVVGGLLAPEPAR